MYDSFFIIKLYHYYFIFFHSEDGRLEERSDRSLLHPAHTGVDPRRRLQKTSPSLQEESNRRAVDVRNIRRGQGTSFTAGGGLVTPMQFPVLKS